MSGNIGEKARAAFLALIMVTSVMAAGVAFSGSAAALSQDDTNLSNGEATIVADSADADTDGTHTVVVQLDDSFDDNLERLKVDYGSSNDDVGLDTLSTTSDLSSNGDIEIWVDGSKVELDVTSGLDIDDTNKYIEIGDIQSTGSAGQDLSGEEGTQIVIELGASNGINNPSDNIGDVTVEVEDNNANQISPTDELRIDQGPIEIDDGSGTSYYNTFDKAVDAATESGVVTVTENLDETGPQTRTPTLGVNNVIIQGQDKQEIQLANDAIDVDGVENTTIQDLTFDGQDNSVIFVKDGGTATNTTITNNEFLNTTGAAAVELNPGGDGSDVITTSVTGNDFTQDIDANAIDIDLGSTNVDDVVEIHSNTVTGLTGSNNAVELTGSATGASVVDINTLNVEGDGNGAGLQLTGDTLDTVSSIDVDGFDVNNTASGITSTGTTTVAVADDLNITNFEVTNAADGIDLSQLTGASDIRITNTTSDGIDVTETGIDVGSAGAPNANLDIHNVDINGSNTGIDAQNEDEFLNISGVVMNNIGDTVGINVAGDASDVNIDGVDIDGDVDNTNAINIADTGVATGATIDITGSTVNSVQNGIVFAEASTDDIVFNVTDNTISDSGTGLDVQEDAGEDTTEPITAIHFNTFENNTVGVNVADAFGGGDRSLNLTFNDVVDNTDGLTVGTVDSNGVNAKYSYWGSDAGPNSDGGDSVTASEGDATTEPFLLESAVDNYDDTNLGGTNVLRFGHNVEVTNNKGSLAFPAVANRTAGEAIEGDTTDVMIYKLVDGAFVDAGDQVPQTMEGHVVDLTEATNDSAFVTITYSDDVADSSGGYTYEQGANLVGAPKQGDAGLDAVFNLKEDYVISPYLDNTGNFYPGDYARTSSISDDSDNKLTGGDDNEVSPFSAYVIEVPDNETRFKGGYIPGGTEASEIDGLLSNGGA